MILATRSDGLVIDDDVARIDGDAVFAWLSIESYWARGRPREVIARSLAGSRVFGVYDHQGQVGLARAVTDRATYAWVCDVIVDAEHRGRGIGSWLVREVVASLRADGVARVVLATRDAHEVYRRLGFGPLRAPDTWMEIDERPTRPPASR
ncbi:MAG TPA: GNAT family N-acetyltransferase [Candidatus Nanopelagicales bacterium]